MGQGFNLNKEGAFQEVMIRAENNNYSGKIKI